MQRGLLLVLGFPVGFFALSIFLNSSLVLAQFAVPFDSILGQDNMESWKDEIMRSIGGSPAGPTNDTSTLVLAANRTKRPDIFSGFHKYRGGWDIANKHYWASVGFTGGVAFLLAVIWFISFGLALLGYYFCGWKVNVCCGNSSCSMRICLLLLTFFTAATVAGCILLSVGQVEFHGEAFDTLNYIVNQSEYTVHILRNVTEYMSLAKNIRVAQNFLPSDVMDDIDRINVNLENAATTLEVKTNYNSSKIRTAFNAVRSALIAVAAVMLLISIPGLVLSLCRHQHMIHIFIVTGWLLVAVTFFLCGVSVILDNTISDTCMAMGEWVENPQAETALSNILPCVNQETTNQTLFKSKLVINDIVNIVNGFVASVANSNPPSNSTSSFYNQSGPLIPPLCYPYDSQLQDRNCSVQELSIENATSLAWQKYTCNVSRDGLCISSGRLTPEMCRQLVGAANVIYMLQHYTPPLLNLQNCNFVRDTFRNIASNYCPPLEHNLDIVNAGLALMSAGAMLSLALWIVYANRPQREEVFAKTTTP